MGVWQGGSSQQLKLQTKLRRCGTLVVKLVVLGEKRQNTPMVQQYWTTEHMSQDANYMDNRGLNTSPTFLWRTERYARCGNLEVFSHLLHDREYEGH